MVQLLIVATLLVQQIQCCCAHADLAESDAHSSACQFDKSPAAADDHDHGHDCPQEGRSGDHPHHFCLGTHVVFLKTSVGDVPVHSPADVGRVAVHPTFVTLNATERLGLDDRFWPPAFVDRAQLGVYHE